MTMSDIPDLDWIKAKAHFDEIRSGFQELEGMSGVSATWALRFVFDPIAKRYNLGERTRELYDEMLNVE